MFLLPSRGELIPTVLKGGDPKFCGTNHDNQIRFHRLQSGRAQEKFALYCKFIYYILYNKNYVLETSLVTNLAPSHYPILTH